MRRSVQPNCPRAMTCCFFVSLKMLAMPAEGPRSLPPRQRLERLLPMAVFQVSMYGRFWVSTEGGGGGRAPGHLQPDARRRRRRGGHEQGGSAASLPDQGPAGRSARRALRGELASVLLGSLRAHPGRTGAHGAGAPELLPFGRPRLDGPASAQLVRW